MRTRIATLLLAAIALLPVSLSAHDASKHKGKAVSGEIVSIAGDQFEIKTASGVTKVTLNANTKFEHGDQAVDKSHLKQGEKVSVIGTRLATGDIVAKEVIIGAAASKHGAKSDHKH